MIENSVQCAGCELRRKFEIGGGSLGTQIQTTSHTIDLRGPHEEADTARYFLREQGELQFRFIRPEWSSFEI